MTKHYIIMSSSYTDGARIALDITEPTSLSVQYVNDTIKKIKEICGQDVPLSTHFLFTESTSWDSVVKYDAFFAGIICVKDVDEFIRKIKKDRVLTGIDVAIYILSKIKCTHLKLQKLAYLCYADYCCEYDEKLFKSPIYAYRYGPVVKDVYDIFRGNGYDILSDENSVITQATVSSAKSRILFAEKGLEKVQSIDRTLEKYGDLSAGELVDLTHRPNAPWSHYDSSLLDIEMKDEDIKSYHYIEAQ